MSEPERAVYVSNGRDGSVTPIPIATGVPGPPIPIGRTAGDIAITPDGQTAYVTSDDGVVVPIATATNTAGPPIQVGDRPYESRSCPDRPTPRSGTIGACPVRYPGTWASPTRESSSMAGTSRAAAGAAEGRRVAVGSAAHSASASCDRAVTPNFGNRW